MSHPGRNDPCPCGSGKKYKRCHSRDAKSNVGWSFQSANIASRKEDSSPRSSADLKEHLKRQLDFLSRSCDAFDHGFQDEAVRIATSLRVLLHDTARSTSLLRLLGAKDRIRLLSTVDYISENAVFADQAGFIRISGDGTATVVPKLEMARVKNLMAVKTWWNQVFYVRNQFRITRKDVILAAANKDGGAHVDP